MTALAEFERAYQNVPNPKVSCTTWRRFRWSGVHTLVTAGFAVYSLLDPPTRTEWRASRSQTRVSPTLNGLVQRGSF